MLVHAAIMQNMKRKTVRPSDSEEHMKFRSIQEDEYRNLFNAPASSTFGISIAEKLTACAIETPITAANGHYSNK